MKTYKVILACTAAAFVGAAASGIAVRAQEPPTVVGLSWDDLAVAVRNVPTIQRRLPALVQTRCDTGYDNIFSFDYDKTGLAYIDTTTGRH